MMLSARMIGSPSAKLDGLISTLSSLIVGSGQKLIEGALPSETGCPAQAPMSRSSRSRTRSLETASGSEIAMATTAITMARAIKDAVRRNGHRLINSFTAVPLDCAMMHAFLVNR